MNANAYRGKSEACRYYCLCIPKFARRISSAERFFSDNRYEQSILYRLWDICNGSLSRVQGRPVTLSVGSSHQTKCTNRGAFYCQHKTVSKAWGIAQRQYAKSDLSSSVRYTISRRTIAIEVYDTLPLLAKHFAECACARPLLLQSREYCLVIRLCAFHTSSPNDTSMDICLKLAWLMVTCVHAQPSVPPPHGCTEHEIQAGDEQSLERDSATDM